MVKKAQIYLVDDHPTLRLGLSQLINQQPGLIVCGEAGDCLSALSGINSTRPDLAIIDINLKQSSGLDLIKDLRVPYPALFLLVLTVHQAPETAARAFRLGANGYLDKQQAANTILTAIQHVLSGKRYISPALRLHLADALIQDGQESGALAKLSDQELAVFRMLGNGCGTEEIAASLHISRSTVHSYCERIKQKLGVATYQKLIAAAAAFNSRSPVQL